MLFPEEKKLYETKIKGTKYIIISESLTDTREDILDSLSRLMVKDCGAVYKSPAPREPLDEIKVKENFKKLGRKLISP